MKTGTTATYLNRCFGDGIMVYKYIDIVGTSKTVITDAVNSAFEESFKNCQEYKVGRTWACDL